MATVELKSRRLFLRPLIESDAKELFGAIEASREILKRRLRWVGEVRSIEDERRFIAEATATMETGDLLLWGIFDSKTSALVGVVGLDKLSSKERTQACFSIWINSSKQDKGYATEVGRVVVECAFRKLNCHRLFVRMDPSNRAFRRVLKKIGFKYEGCLRDDKRLNGRWIDQECWGLLKSEWKK
jgi:ribosomal-protein-alanine N-acetyltransferase